MVSLFFGQRVFLVGVFVRWGLDLHRRRFVILPFLAFFGLRASVAFLCFAGRKRVGVGEAASGELPEPLDGG